MRIEKIIENKKQFLDLLLLAVEQENMIDKYLPNGDLFALYDSVLKSVCVVVPINSETCELKNISTYEKYKGKGYGRALINFISDFYKNDYKTMLVGTGETPAILSFYESCGFEESHRVKNFLQTITTILCSMATFNLLIWYILKIFYRNYRLYYIKDT
jgi:GNAT superfamily N-acetyltransferase